MRRWLIGALSLACAMGCGDDDAGLPDAPVTACDDGQFCNGIETVGDDGVCVAGAPPCPEGSGCMERDDTCSRCETPDADGDGEAAIDCGGRDCDDSDSSRGPGIGEICDPEGVDEDCDPTTFGDRDVDGDGVVSSACCNGGTCGLDCDDTRASARPGATEVCNLRDDDCDGSVDEEVGIVGFADRDGDLHGDPSAPLSGCAGWAGLSITSLDCDDTDPTRHGAQVEVRDGIDNDCDGRIDEEVGEVTWYRDFDADGFGDASAPTMRSDAPIVGHSRLGTDCDDRDPTRSPGTAERCNARDDDCDPRTTFRLGLNDDEDDDGDGWADARCPGIAAADRDCDDTDPAVHPRAPERCNGVDDDCDGEVDERCDEPFDAGVPDAGDAGVLDAGACDLACDAPEAVLRDCGCTTPGESCAPFSSSQFRCAPRGSALAGEPCAVSADCAPVHECRGLRCVELCAPISMRCTGDRFCSRTLWPTTYFSTVPAGLGLCTEDCDPFEDEGCPANTTCGIAAPTSAFFPYCRTLSATPLPIEAPCERTAECAAGLICELRDATRVCLGICGAECPLDRECGVISELTDGTPFRTCWPS